MSFLYRKNKRKYGIYLFVLVAFLLQVTFTAGIPSVYADENPEIADEVTETITNEGPEDGDGEVTDVPENEGPGNNQDVEDNGTENGNPIADEDFKDENDGTTGDSENENPDDNIEEESDGNIKEEPDNDVGKQTGDKQDNAGGTIVGTFFPAGKNIQPLGNGDNQDLGDIFTDVVLKIKHGTDDEIDLNDGDVIDIQDGTVIKLEYEWEIDNDVNLTEGDFAETTIPSVFQGLTGNLTGDLEWGSDTVGTYSIDGDTLRVEFNEVLEGLHSRSGTAWVWLEFI